MLVAAKRGGPSSIYRYLAEYPLFSAKKFKYNILSAYVYAVAMCRDVYN
jgi:hypothetical protein